MQWWCAALGEAWEWTWRPYPGVWAFLALLVAAYVLVLRGSPAPPGGTRDRGTRAAAFGAGALYAFGAYRAVYAALGHYDLVSTGFIPFFALFFLKSFWGKERQKAKGRR